MKKIVAKTGEYQKDGQTKGRYVDVGVINSNDKGEYVILNPEVNLAGILLKQNALAVAGGKQVRDNVMCSIFDNSNQGQQGFGQSQPMQQKPQGHAPGQGGGAGFEDDTPFISHMKGSIA